MIETTGTEGLACSEAVPGALLQCGSMALSAAVLKSIVAPGEQSGKEKMSILENTSMSARAIQRILPETPF
ncbi:hypothetical protein [Vannielia sp. SX4]|uniref:hypothetical protein n=1 Tax=Vannielia sp. SX4 TaxID=3463852 RepID=UPI004058FCB4